MSRRNKTFQEKLGTFIENQLGFTPLPWQLDLLEEMFQKPDTSMLVEAIPTKKEGMTVVHVHQDTHTIVLDQRILKKTAILEFIEAINKSPHTSAITQDAEDEIVALAVAEFNVSLADLDEKLDLYKINDHALATILRIRHDMENPS